MRNISAGSVYGCWKTDFSANEDVVSTKTTCCMLSDSMELLAVEVYKSSYKKVLSQYVYSLSIIDIGLPHIQSEAIHT